MKYKLHKITEKDLIRLEKKLGLSINTTYTSNSYCLVDKNGAVKTTDDGVLRVFQAVGVKNNAKGAILGLAQAYAYFKNTVDGKIKEPDLEDAFSPAKEKLKGLGKVETIKSLNFTDNVLESAKDLERVIKGAFKTLERAAENMNFLVMDVSEKNDLKSVALTQQHDVTLAVPSYLQDDYAEDEEYTEEDEEYDEDEEHDDEEYEDEEERDNEEEEEYEDER